jgi:hypothetical protein
MSDEIVNLRPHHLNSVLWYLGGLIDLAGLYKNPENAELRSSVRGFFAASNLWREIYQGSAWNKIGEIANRLARDPDIFIRLVRGGDDICGECIFQERCLRGDYSEVKAAYRAKGQSPQRTSDEEVLKQWGRDYGDIKRARELFELS